MVSAHIVRRLLLAVAGAWGLTAMVALAAMGEVVKPATEIDLRRLSPEDRNEKIRTFIDDMAQLPKAERELKHHWLERQLSALSPDERDQLRSQIRDHMRRMTPEQRQRLREVEFSDQNTPDPLPGSNRQELHPQRLTPDERQEFRHWMQEHRRGG